MKSALVLWCMVPLSALVIPACSRDQPTAPRLHALSGHVRLTGYLVDAEGRFAGTRVVGDADGVAVELVYGDQVIARTLSAHGAYRFTGLGPGGYFARARVIGSIGDRTRVVTIAGADITAGDTLRIASLGDIYPVPNPSALSTDFYFVLRDTEYVDVRVIDVAGNLVRSLHADEMWPGQRVVTWGGIDQRGRPAPPGLYWVTLVAGDDYRAQLLFR
jgi:hypothetical protein